MGFRLLSNNTIILLEELSRDEDLVQLIHNTSREPFKGEPIRDGGALIPNTLNPTPFAGEVPKDQRVELRVFFPEGRVDKRVKLDSTVSFQVVIHKDLWLINGKNGELKLRPYEIMARITNIFRDKTFKELGVLHFRRYGYKAISENYGLYTLEATATLYQDC